jgi:GntR family transcriptional repressor for pyruvate dehydrogenase complex
MNDAPARRSDAIAAQLESRILEGSLKAGDRLPAERRLAADLGVSRPPLREALHKLASKGLIVTRHGSGTYVTGRLEATFADPWQEMLSGHPMLQGDLLEFRHTLEAQAAAFAAERATAEDIRRIDEAIAALDAVYATDDLEACVTHDVAFHQAIAMAAHNVVISQLTASLFRVLHGHVAGNLEHLHARPHQWSRLKAQHHAIWKAIRTHDPLSAARAVRAHIEFVQRSMEDAAREASRRASRGS